MKKRKVSRDGGEIHFTRAEYKCLRAHRQGIQQEKASIFPPLTLP
jgi:hypothetical protein